MRFRLLITVLLVPFLFSACNKEDLALFTKFMSATKLPSSLSNKLYDYESVQNQFCSANNGCVSVDQNTIVFSDEGYLFAVFKGVPPTSGNDCWLEINGVKKIIPYRNMFVVLIGQVSSDREVDVSQTSRLGTIYLVDNLGRYAKIGVDAKDVEVDGVNLLAITTNGIQRYKGNGGDIQLKTTTKQIEENSFDEESFYEDNNKITIEEKPSTIDSTPAISFKKDGSAIKVKLINGLERSIDQVIAR